MLRFRSLQALCVLVALLESTAGDIFALPTFDTVHIDNLLNNEATVVVTPSFDGSYYLNASMPGLSYAVNTQTNTLELSQQPLGLDPVSGLLNEVLHPGIYQEDEAAANSTAGELIIIALASPLRALSSSTSNDVVVGSNFTTDGFTSQNSGTGKLIVLAIFTNATSVINAGGGSSYIQGDLGEVKVASTGEGGVYLGASSQYPGSISSVDVEMSGTGNTVVATSNGSTIIYGQSQDAGVLLYNQGTCNVTGPADGGARTGDACQLVTVTVPALAQYWALADAAQSAVLSATAPPPPPSPPPPSPPPPTPQRDGRVPAKELTNLITTLEAIPAPAPAPALGYPAISPEASMPLAPVVAPAPAPGMPPAVAPSFVPLVIGTAGPSVSDDGFTSSLVASGPNSSFMHEESTQDLVTNNLGG
ncbi:g12291 [Coccomyxa viridis]|uniref:G12291 protein n=1 Tax=Coccomyxa viridis TaxID=1274662 RepID=A0ABP1GB32_9CHLO